MSLPLVAGGIVQAILYLLFIRFVDLYEREPLRYVIPVFVWGFTVAVVLSLFFEAILSYTVSAIVNARVANTFTAVIGAPVIEECSKGLALLIVFVVSYVASRRRGPVEFSGVMDGIVYGSAVGFGFSIAEDLIYYAQFGPETFLVRRIFGGFAHASFTSLTGIGIGLIPWVRHRALKPVPPILGLLSAILLHALFNFTASFFGGLAYVVLFFVLVCYAVVIVLWLALERRTIRSELRDEVATGVVSPEEFEILPTYFRRSFHYLRLLLGGHVGAWFRERKAHRAAVDLALTKHTSRSRWTGAQDARVVALREKVVRLGRSFS